MVVPPPPIDETEDADEEFSVVAASMSSRAGDEGAVRTVVEERPAAMRMSDEGDRSR